MKKITWTNERRKVAELLPASYNPRSLSEDEKRNLQASIVENGEVEPVVINIGTRNNTLIGGHQRCVVYAELGIQEIDVRVPSQELTLDEEKRLNLHLNHSTGHFEFEKLKEMDMDMLLDVGFGGGGSTMIACEHLGRRCCMIELSVDYCATIIARWEKLTNLKTEKLPTV